MTVSILSFFVFVAIAAVTFAGSFAGSHYAAQPLLRLLMDNNERITKIGADVEALKNTVQTNATAAQAHSDDLQKQLDAAKAANVNGANDPAMAAALDVLDGTITDLNTKLSAVEAAVSGPAAPSSAPTTTL